MAIAANHLATSGSGTDASSYATASITPTADALVLAVVQGSHTSAVPQASLSGNGLTWVQVATLTYSNSGLQHRTQLFRAMGGSPSSGAVTIDYGSTVFASQWSIGEFTGVNTGGTNGSSAIQQVVTATDSNTITLAAFANSANAAYGAFTSDGVATYTAGSGFTLFGQDQQTSPNIVICSEYQLANDTTVDVSFAAPSQTGYAVEVNEAAVSPSTVNTAVIIAQQEALFRRVA